MPKAMARRLSSLPMRPMPMMPSVLLWSSTPWNSFRFHFPLRTRGVGLRDFARGAEQEREGVLGGGDGVAAGRVHDDHAAARGGLDVHIIDADASAADDAQSCAGLQDGRGDFRFAAHDDGAEIGNELDERGFRQAGFFGDVERGIAGEFVETALRNRIGY